MKGRAAKEQAFLQYLGAAKTHKQRKVTVAAATRGQILALAELVVNILNGIITVPENLVKILARYKRHLRVLGARSNTDWKKRRQAVLKSVRVLGNIVSQILNQREMQHDITIQQEICIGAVRSI